ncbi:MAG TPA: hypothetical protein VFW09_16830 [Solirubrobacteraceae bacterium]|nr:hypothetical protein [Solirubrobacteraceae bacterium]
MSIDAVPRADYVRALPTFAETAALIGLDPSGVSRAVKKLGIEPLPWGNREKHLAVADVLRIAMHAKRSALEEVGGRLLDWAEREHADQAEEIRLEIDAFFAGLPEPEQTPQDQLIAELRAGLPAAAAERAIEIYLSLTSKTK